MLQLSNYIKTKNTYIMKTLNKVTSLQLIRNMKHIEYRKGLCTLGEVDDSENKLSQYLNTI